MATLIGCQSASEPTPMPADYLKITALSAPAPLQTENPVFANFPEAFEHVVQIPLMIEPASTGQATALELVQARRQVVEGVSLDLARYLDRVQPDWRERLGARPAIREQLEALIESQTKVNLLTSPDQVEAQASLPGSTVAEFLRNTDIFAAHDSRSSEQRRQSAYNEALKKAKYNLRETLLEMPLEDDEAFGEFLKGKRAAQNDFNALLIIAKPDQVRYRDDDSCEITLFFDRNRIRQLAEDHDRGWLGIF